MCHHSHPGRLHASHSSPLKQIWPHRAFTGPCFDCFSVRFGLVFMVFLCIFSTFWFFGDLDPRPFVFHSQSLYQHHRHMPRKGRVFSKLFGARWGVPRNPLFVHIFFKWAIGRLNYFFRLSNLLFSIEHTCMSINHVPFPLYPSFLKSY